MERLISKSKFKAQALEYFRHVEETGQELVITDRGRPVVKIVACRDTAADNLKELRHSVIRYEGPAEPVGLEDWEALS